MKTLVHEDCMFECNPPWSLQPVQLTQERSNVIVVVVVVVVVTSSSTWYVEVSHRQTTHREIVVVVVVVVVTSSSTWYVEVSWPGRAKTQHDSIKVIK